MTFTFETSENWFVISLPFQNFTGVIETPIETVTFEQSTNYPTIMLENDTNNPATITVVVQAGSNATNMNSQPDTFDMRRFKSALRSWSYLVQMSNLTNLEFGLTGCTKLATVTIGNGVTSNVTNMRGLFLTCNELNSPIILDMSLVTNAAIIFFECHALNSPVTFSNPLVLTNLESAFSSCTSFNQPFTLNAPMLSNIGSCFTNCAQLNSPITIQSTQLINCSNTFKDCSALNQAVTIIPGNQLMNTSSMFEGCRALVQAPSIQNTSQVTDMSRMFLNCSELTELPTLNTSSVQSMVQMFYGCIKFDESLESFDIRSLTNASGMLGESGISAEAYSRTLIAWANQPIIQRNVQFRSSAQYARVAEASRNKLITNYGWLITDAGLNTTINTICVVPDTLVETDQGILPICEINAKKHTIQGVGIRRITVTQSIDKYWVLLEPHALGPDQPTYRTIVTANHALQHRGELKKAISLVNQTTIRLVPNDGRDVYNVLLAQPQPGLMCLNGQLVAETLDPSNSIVTLLDLMDQCPVEMRPQLWEQANAAFLRNMQTITNAV